MGPRGPLMGPRSPPRHTEGRQGTPEGARYTVLYNALTGAVDFIDSDQASFEDIEE